MNSGVTHFGFRRSKILPKLRIKQQKTRILRELHEVRETVKMKPKVDTDYQTIIPDRFTWSDTLLTAAEKTSKWNFYGWLSLNSCQTLEWTLRWAGRSRGAHADRRWSCLSPKSNNANALGRRPNCWVSSDAHLWNHHGTAYLQVRKTDIYAEVAQWKTTSSCGYQEDQMSDCGWLHEQKSSS